MSLLRRRRSRPRLMPELDDTELGRPCRRLTECGFNSSASLDIIGMARLLDGTGEDWDRRSHRSAVLSEASSRASPGTGTVVTRWRPSPQPTTRHGDQGQEVMSDPMGEVAFVAGADSGIESCRRASTGFPVKTESRSGACMGTD